MISLKTSSAKVFLSLLLSVLMVWVTTPVTYAAGPASPAPAPPKPLGALITGGAAEVRGMAVRYETTLFDGDSIKTQGTTARLNLTGGTRVDLTLYTEGTIEKIDGVPTVVLKQGVARFASAAPFAMKVGNLRLVADNAQASVTALGQGTTVAVKSGSVSAINEQARQTAQLKAGESAVFDKTGEAIGNVVYAANPGGGSPRPRPAGGGASGATIAAIAGIGAGIAGVVVGVVAHNNANDANDRAAAAEAQAASLASTVATLQSTITTLNSQIASLSSQLATARAQLTSLINANAQERAALIQIGQLQARLAADAAQLATIQAQIAALLAGPVRSGGQAAISDQLQALLNQLQDLINDINSISAAIAAILNSLPPLPPNISP